jgi:hypothetical protein
MRESAALWRVRLISVGVGAGPDLYLARQPHS